MIYDLLFMIYYSIIEIINILIKQNNNNNNILQKLLSAHY